MKYRSFFQKTIDFVTFPIRALAIIHDDWGGLSSLDTERFEYITKEVTGYCLDVGCGRHNRLITRFLNGNGIGIDVFKYDGLTDDQIVDDITKFPFDSNTFDSITYSAVISHIPKSQRDIEMAETYRCLKPGGNVIITEGNPVAQVLTHKLVEFYDKFLGTNIDIDSERGMHEEEAYFLTNTEIRKRLRTAGFVDIQLKYFWTQWGLNHLFVGWKR